jgi:hypothetical protein
VIALGIPSAIVASAWWRAAKRPVIAPRAWCVKTVAASPAVMVAARVKRTVSFT